MQEYEIKIIYNYIEKFRKIIIRNSMKRVLIIALLLILAGSQLCYAETPQMKTGINQYNSGEYEKCISTIKSIVKEDPTQVIGYYYLGLAYSKTGKNILAVQNFNRVIALNTDKHLVELAKQGKNALGNKTVTSVESQIEDLEDEIKDNPILNDCEKLSPDELRAKYEEKISTPASKVIKASDYIDKTNSQNQSQNTQPTNDDIVNAIRTLQKAGILNNGITPMQAGVMPMPMDSRTQQMNSMLMMMNGGNNNNGMMNMMPYMNNGGNVDPQLMQMMLMNQMMPNFSSGGNGNGY